MWISDSVSENFKRLFAASIVLWGVAAFGFSSAWATTERVDFPDWERRQNAEQRLTVFGDGLMGDQVDPSTGALVFSHTDIDIPGNFSLPVRVERRRAMGSLYLAGFGSTYGVDVEFGDWELVVPKISALTTQIGQWKNGGNRCSGTFDQNFPDYLPHLGGLLADAYYGDSYRNYCFLAHDLI